MKGWSDTVKIEMNLSVRKGWSWVSDEKRLTITAPEAVPEAALPIVIPEAAEVKPRMSETADVALVAADPEALGLVVEDTPLAINFSDYHRYEWDGSKRETYARVPVTLDPVCPQTSFNCSTALFNKLCSDVVIASCSLVQSRQSINSLKVLC